MLASLLAGLPTTPIQVQTVAAQKRYYTHILQKHANENTFTSTHVTPISNSISTHTTTDSSYSSASLLSASVAAATTSSAFSCCTRVVCLCIFASAARWRGCRYIPRAVGAFHCQLVFDRGPFPLAGRQDARACHRTVTTYDRRSTVRSSRNQRCQHRFCVSQQPRSQSDAHQQWQ